MTSTVLIPKHRERLKQLCEGFGAERDGHGIELQMEPPILELRPDQVVHVDDFHLAMTEHRMRHAKTGIAKRQKAFR